LLAEKAAEVTESFLHRPVESRINMGHKKPQITRSPQDVWRSPWGRVFFWVSLPLVPASFLAIFMEYAPFGFIKRSGGVPISIFDLVVYAIWTLVPPAWFFLEYNFLFPSELKVKDVALEDMKYTQELASKFWIALVALLTAALLFRYGNFPWGHG
jgi:hypothetical protein